MTTRHGYKLPDELQIEPTPALTVTKYVEQLTQGLGLNNSPKSSNKRKKTVKKDSETSSDEERWLDAIQSGKLEEVDDELKKIKPKDPKLMTARQRAMLDRNKEGKDGEPVEQLMALPSGYKEVVMTAEAIQRKAIKSQKRKEKADEKREKDKKKTMERLLKKQDSKSVKSAARKGSGPGGAGKKDVPQITWRSTADGPHIDLPLDIAFPLQAVKSREPKAARLCHVKGCRNLRRYSSKTGVSLCSLECYRKVCTVK